MLAVNPEDRINITDSLKIFSNEICPNTITGFLFHFNSVIISTNLPDLIIGHLYCIWKFIFGVNDNTIPLKQNINYVLVNKIILEVPFFKWN